MRWTPGSKGKDSRTADRVILLYSWAKHVNPTIALSTGELSGGPDEMLEVKLPIDSHLIWKRLGEGKGGGNNNPSRFMLRKPQKAIAECATWLDNRLYPPDF